MPSMPMPNATTQRCSAKCTPSIINATRSSSDRSACHHLGQRRLGHGHEPAATPPTSTSTDATAADLGADRFRARPGSGESTAWPSSAPARARPAARSTRTAHRPGTATSAVLSAVRTRGRRTGTRRPPNVTEPASVPWRTAMRFGSWRPFGPANAITSLVHQRVHHLQAGADRECQQPFSHRAGQARPSRRSPRRHHELAQSPRASVSV